MNLNSSVAAGFSISGLLDESTQTQARFPIEEVPVKDIAEHPANAVYSMNSEGIARLAESIKRDGLTDLPLERRCSDGSLQMLSGHRRKAAYALLAKDDPAYEKMPCRIVEGIADAQALTLLHAANYFTRTLTVTERAAATRALGFEVERLREETPSFSGMRTEDVKAAIVESSTGRKVSGKTIKRQEALADLIQTSLAPKWQTLADTGVISARVVRELAKISKDTQTAIFDSMPEDIAAGSIGRYVLGLLPADTHPKSKPQAAPEKAAPDADTRLVKAADLLADYLKETPKTPSDADLEICALIARLSANLPSQANSTRTDTSSGLRRVS